MMSNASEFRILPNTPRSIVAESPIWDRQTQTLYWVDIVDKKIFRYRYADQVLDQWATEHFPTAIALVADENDAIVAFDDGVFRFDFETGERRLAGRPDDLEGNRLNEGKCDPLGRFWVGSMQTNLNPDGSMRQMTKNSGALFSYDGGQTLQRHTDFEFGISNTLAWSPDMTKLYFGDSIRNVIFAYDFDVKTGAVGNRTVLLEDFPRGAPDGSAIDADGCLWNARFGGSCVIKISPKGEVLETIELPVKQPTSCTFAGQDNDMLIITSASFTMSDEDLAANPNEGCVLQMKTNSIGLVDQRFQARQVH